MSGAAAAVSPDRIEQLSLSAWPALSERELDGWRLRIGRGRSRRANSVWPLAAGTQPLDAKIAACERAFTEAGRPIVFRIPSITPARGLDDALAGRGYAKDGKTSVRLADLAGFAHRPSGAVALEPDLSDAWLDTFARFDGMSPDERDEQRAISALTRHPMMFASVRDGAAIVAVAAAVLQDAFVYFHSVATDPAYRRRGLGRAIMIALLDWAKRHGAAYAYLPVEKGNAPGLALYNGLGFTTELYRYHYRQPRR